MDVLKEAIEINEVIKKDKKFDQDTLQINPNFFNYPYQVSSKNPRPLDCFENFKWMIDFLGIKISYNEMTRSCEAIIPGFNPSWEDRDNLEVIKLENIAALNDLSRKNISQYVLMAAHQNSYHPVKQILRKNAWDKTSRWDDFVDTIQATNPKLAKALIKKWMLQAIAAVHSECGYAAQSVLVLLGKQNIGKTTWIKKLGIVEHAVQEGVILDPKDKDIVRQANSYWINEIGELDGTFRKADIARLKSFLTSSVDMLRCPYAKKATYFARRSVFAASVNEAKFLTDQTGNRRFWVIEIESIKRDHGIDMLQVWAEVYHHWKNGMSSELAQDEFNELNKSNIKHEQADSIEELILDSFDWKLPGRVWATSTQICDVLNLPKEKCVSVGRSLSKMYKNLSKENGGDLELSLKPYANRTLYLVPEYTKKSTFGGIGVRWLNTELLSRNNEQYDKEINPKSLNQP